MDKEFAERFQIGFRVAADVTSQPVPAEMLRLLAQFAKTQKAPNAKPTPADGETINPDGGS
jgi:hypothetical protein